MDVVAPWSWAPVAPSQHTQKPGFQILLSYLNSATIPREVRGPIHRCCSHAAIRIELCSLLHRNAFPQCLRYRRGVPSVDSEP